MYMPQGPLKDVDQLVQTEGREQGRRFAKKLKVYQVYTHTNSKGHTDIITNIN